MTSWTPDRHEPTFPYVRTPRKAGWFARAWAAFMRQESFLVRFWTAFGLLYVLALLVTWLMR